MCLGVQPPARGMGSLHGVCRSGTVLANAVSGASSQPLLIGMMLTMGGIYVLRACVALPLTTSLRVKSCTLEICKALLWARTVDMQWTHSGHTVDTQWTHSGHWENARNLKVTMARTY